MSQWHLIVDVARCENCGNCTIASKDEHVGNDFPGYSAPHTAQGPGVIRIERTIRGSGSQVDAAYLPRMCNHCADAPCMKAAPDAISRRPDGIVIIDAIKAKGRREIVDACPYGAVVWNEERELPQQWIFDAHLLDQGWKQPRCQQSCPTGVFTAVKATDQEMATRAAAEELEALKPELATKPRVLYRNLHRVSKCMVAGSVFARVRGAVDCVEGADIALLKDGTEVATAKSDSFGDFKFERVEPNSGAHRVEIHHAALGAASVDIQVGRESIALGDVELRR